MIQPSRFILVVLTMLTTACTTLSESGQPLDVAEQLEVSETRLEFKAEYENAKQECADEGGRWTVLVQEITAGGIVSYQDFKRCFSRDEPWRPQSRDSILNLQRLLPYDIALAYESGSSELLGFRRINPRIIDDIYEKSDTDAPGKQE